MLNFPETKIFTASSLLVMTLVWFGPLQAQTKPAQNRQPQVKAHPAAIHLVGDEDIGLLNRIQDVIDDWDPRKLQNPYVEEVPGIDPANQFATKKMLRRKDLNEFIADVSAAEALGKAFFWEMQAGSDFRRVNGKYLGSACASCHFRFGADSRNTFTTRIPYVVWDQYQLDPQHGLAYNETPQSFDVEKLASAVIPNRSSLYQNLTRPPFTPDTLLENVDGLVDDDESPATPLSLIVGSQGVEPRLFRGLSSPGVGEMDWASEQSVVRNPMNTRFFKPEWSMFIKAQASGGQSFRQITSRNSPSVINAGFANRLFHDGRAESTFNGFSIFGDQDKREIIHKRKQDGRLVPVRIALTNSALASQAVGPVVSDVEMSYRGRTFHDLAKKLIDAPVLGYQDVADDDSHLGISKQAGLIGPGSSYRALIRRAFRREWWDGSAKLGEVAGQTASHAEDQQNDVELGLDHSAESRGTLMQANFSLYWGISLLLYEASLISNDTPFDHMMKGDPKPVNQLWQQKKSQLEPVYIDRLQTTNPKPSGTNPFAFKSGAEVFQRGFRAFLNRGCFDCHSGPLFSELYSRVENSEAGTPIDFTMERLLLPYSKADSIAISLAAEKQKMLDDVKKLIGQNSAVNIPDSLKARMAVELDLLREQAFGRETVLRKMVSERLKTLIPPPNNSAAIAKVLMTYEKTASTKVGNRLFFTEDNRVALAKLMVDPVLIEKMLIPLVQVPTRRTLLISGAKASPPYAFYDLGFYTLGVAPPRYDRGNGDWSYNWDDVAPETIVEGKTPRVTVTHHQIASGSAYQFNPLWKHGIKGDLYYENEVDDSHHPDLSWYRDLPIWNRDFPNLNPDENPIDKRRNDVHLFSRARSLVMDETLWGYRKPLNSDNELAFWGAFKTPSLRNVELTGPYMHNGRLQSLFDVLEFYDRGGDLPADLEQNPDKHPAMVKLNLEPGEKLAIVFFLMCLTDGRVQSEKAPFDHPSIRMVNGYQADLTDKVIELETVGAGGVDPGTMRKSFPSDQ